MKNMLEPPPGILDLILWNPSPDDHDHLHAEAFDLQPRPWSELPENLLHSVLAWLPFRSILRFRSVCRDWKALFDSPSFHHFPSHAPHVPPWIFFLGTRYRRRLPSTYTGEESESDTDIHYDDGRDDNGFVFEGSEQGSDDDSDSLMSVCDDSGDAQDAMRHGEHGNIYGALLSDDHESMHDVGRCFDHVDTQGAVARKDTRMKDSEPFEELLLIFDCASESWRPPLAMPTGFKMRADNVGATRNFFARFNVCSSQEYVLIPTCSDMSRFFLFNPGAPLCKELPPCIASQEMEAVGFSVEMATPSRSNVAGDLPSLSKRSAEQSVQATADKIMQVVVVGEIGNYMYAVENFSSTTGSWRICGYLQHSDDLYFMQRKMVFYKGSFYGMTTKGIMKLDIVQESQSMEYTFREIPVTPTDNDPPDVFLTESRLLVTKDSLYMVGVTYTYVPNSNDIEEWNILIWEYLPHAADNACWKFQAYAPKPILDNYFGESQVTMIECHAHGDLIFFGLHTRQRFLIYELRTKVWRFSVKSKWFLGPMSFIWEPLLRN